MLVCNNPSDYLVQGVGNCVQIRGMSVDEYNELLHKVLEVHDLYG